MRRSGSIRKASITSADFVTEQGQYHIQVSLVLWYVSVAGQSGRIAGCWFWMIFRDENDRKSFSRWMIPGSCVSRISVQLHPPADGWLERAIRVVAAKARAGLHTLCVQICFHDGRAAAVPLFVSASNEPSV